MAKKIKIFSELILGIASAFTLGYAVSIKPASACVGADGKPIVGKNGEVANCVELTEPSEPGTLISPTPEFDDVYSEADAEVKSEKTINHSYFLAGNQIESSDNINGLAAFAGNGIKFSGTSEYATLAGNSIVIDGYIEKDLFVAGNVVEITEEASIGRDIFGVANSFSLKSSHDGNIFISGNRLVLDNVIINGDLSAGFDEITIKGNSSVSGKFTYNDTAVVTGLDNLSAGEIVTYAGAKKDAISFTAALTDKLLSIFGRLLVTIVFVAACAKFSKRLLDEFVASSSWKYIGLGLALLVAVPLACIFVMVSIIGLPLGIIGFIVYGLSVYFAESVTGGVIGNLIAKNVFKQPKMHAFLKYTIGIILIELLTLVPYVGALIGAVSTCFGFGYLVRKLFRQPNKSKR